MTYIHLLHIAQLVLAIWMLFEYYATERRRKRLRAALIAIAELPPEQQRQVLADIAHGLR